VPDDVLADAAGAIATAAAAVATTISGRRFTFGALLRDFRELSRFEQVTLCPSRRMSRYVSR
jgi:hypothetical protein